MLSQQKNGEEEWDFCTEHKPAGRKPHFYHSFNFDFLSGEVPSPLLLTRSLPLQLSCPLSQAFRLYPLCVCDSAPCHDSDTSKLPATANNCSHVRNWPRGTKIMGAKCETFSHDKCRSVTAVLKDCLSTGLTNCRMHKERKRERERERIKQRQTENSWWRQREM